MKEREIQRYVQQMLADPSKVWTTDSGKRLQVLSPGRINPFGGPDYVDIALLLDGTILVGDAEFHRNSSDWKHHNHSVNSDYQNVVLHIVFNNNMQIEQNFETLVIDSKKLSHEIIFEKSDDKEIAKNAEDLQHFALVRLLRKATEAQKMLNHFSIDDSLVRLSADFISNYEKKRRRPVYSDRKLDDILLSIRNSQIMSFLKEIESGSQMNISDKMLSLIKTKISVEGSAFRRELVLNAVLPLALCLSDESARINLFLWYWSTPALNKYGVLSRFFPELSQSFLWQQQGMLEYLRDRGNKRNVIADALSNYGFGEVLSFYRQGKPPFEENE